jgi:hypothetical protein
VCVCLWGGGGPVLGYLIIPSHFLSLVRGSLSNKICFLESFFTTSPGGAAATYSGAAATYSCAAATNSGAAATYMMDKTILKLTQPS